VYLTYVLALQLTVIRDLRIQGCKRHMFSNIYIYIYIYITTIKKKKIDKQDGPGPHELWHASVLSQGPAPEACSSHRHSRMVLATFKAS
jgi:hypothetical protein